MFMWVIVLVLIFFAFGWGGNRGWNNASNVLTSIPAPATPAPASENNG